MLFGGDMNDSFGIKPNIAGRKYTRDEKRAGGAEPALESKITALTSQFLQDDDFCILDSCYKSGPSCLGRAHEEH